MPDSTSTPVERPSDESDLQQIALARRQGDAFDAAVDEMTHHEAHGREQRAGDFVVGFAIEHAEGTYVVGEGGLKWKNPEKENAHVEVVVRDAVDGRFIPNLNVTVTIEDTRGRTIGTHEQPFLWHPWLFHYGRNWILPGTGEYTVRVHVDAPEFARHDKFNGRRYMDPVDVEFTHVHIDTGRKLS